MNEIKLDIALRSATEKDGDFLWDLHRVSLKPYVEQSWGWDENFQRRYFWEHFTPEKSQVIQSEGVDAGVLTVEESTLGYILSNIELLPRFQGRGIGTSLITSLLEKADQRGLPISLRVLKINPARQLYERLGFIIIGETETHYWMRREGQPREFLPDRWETSRLFLVRVNESALSSVQQIFSENHDTFELLGEGSSPADQAVRYVRYESIPPGGVLWREQRFLIREMENRDSVGIMSVYFGYPTPETMYIGTLFFRPIYQNRGYGHEVVKEIEKRAASIGFREARAGVGLKNWPALRFWTSCGYSRITKIKGDSDFSAGSTANVELSKDLEPDPPKVVPVAG